MSEQRQVVGRPTSDVIEFFFGRHELRDVFVDGPAEAVPKLRGSDLGM